MSGTRTGKTSSRSERRVLHALSWASLLVALTVGACTTPESIGGSASGPSTTDTSPATTVAPTTAPPGTDQPRSVASVDDLVVAPESDGDGYERELFGGDWIDEDGDGCDTREEVLIDESVSQAQVDPYGCKVIAGDWVSLFDGGETSDPSDLDIDHVVALSEAWRSGADDWTEDRRVAFANDLDNPMALIAVSASSNRSKGDRDPTVWQPTRQESWCEFGTAWMSVKVEWDLTADQAEVDALRDMLAGC